MKIGVMGDKGSFSEEAGIYYAQENNIKNFDIKYLVNADNVLKNITSDAVDIGIMPLENSNGGVVLETIYAMAKYKFSIRKMFEMDIRHCLMVKGGMGKSGVLEIASHPQALKQCKTYLERQWNNAKIIEWEDTAKAAKDLADGQLSEDTAIIAPKRCAELYGLTIIEENIQDLKFNFTSFLAVTKE